MTNEQHTALVTGGTSGLGFEAAIHLATEGFCPVIITGRTAERAEAARSDLVAQTGLNVFETVALDLGDPESVTAAAATLAVRGGTIDALLLNAGMVAGSNRTVTDEGIEVTYAASLIGHHQLTMELLAQGSLAPDANIVIAGSEAARGDVPTFKVADLDALASKSFDGDLDAAAEALVRSTPPVRYSAASAYANAKLFVAWWAAALSRRIPDGMTVNAVSPGAAPHTSMDRNANFFMKRVMLPMFKRAPKFLKLAAPTDVAARRYVDILQAPGGSGVFYASAPKKMTGTLYPMEHAHFHNEAHQEAAWRTVVRVARGLDYRVSA